MKPYWQNPEIQQLNRLPMRSPLFPFATKEQAVTTASLGCEHCPEPDTPWYQSLDGCWQFALLDAPEDDCAGSRYDAWQAPSYDASGWTQIQVPLTWTLQGFDKPHYTNVQMPFGETPPFTPAHNPTGLYRLPVTVAESWRGRRIVLHVGSAESCLLVYVNGDFVGLSKDTRLPAEFDITEQVDWSAGEGKALVALKVVRYSDASFVEDQDQWWFGGIHRSVYLYSTEQTYLSDVEALTSVSLQPEKTTGTVQLTVPLGYQVRGLHVPKKTELDTLNRIVRYELYELHNGAGEKPEAGSVVAQGSATLCYDYLETCATVRAELSVDNPKLWSSEKPALYVLCVSLHEADSNPSAVPPRLIEATACTIGFKTVAVEKRELRINGKKVYIHGVNRHEHNEYTGKTLTVAQMKQDIVLMKRYHFNAVRTCHYPNDERWYDLCDRYGIYIMDEANIENHAYYDLMCRSDEWANAYMQRVQRMYRRDKNHACVFSWSLGNESGAAQNQDALAAWLHSVDPTRVVHSEGYARPWFRQKEYTLESLAGGRGKVDLVSPMYPSIDIIARFADTVDDPRPLIMCEYSHAMGNANGSLADYWKTIESHHGLQGGFIWDWIDQGLAATDKTGKKYWKYGGDFGDEPTDLDFCLNGLLFPDQRPKPALEECRCLFAPVRLHEVSPEQGLFEVENCFDFTSLDALKADWILLLNGKQIAGGELFLPALAPGERALIAFPVADALTKHNCADGELSLIVSFVYASDTNYAASGTLCARSGFVLRARPEALLREAVMPLTDVGAVSERGKALSELSDQVRPQLFRALVENECIKARLSLLDGSRGRFSCQATASWIHADLLGMKLSSDGALFAGPAAYAGMEGKKLGSFEKCVSHFTAKDGTAGIMLDLRFVLSDALPEYPRVGITFPVDASFQTATWYGRGPHENYSDRAYSACIGTYTLPVAELETPYIVPQENGTRTDVRTLVLANEQGKKLYFAAETPFAFSLSRYTTEDLWKRTHTNELTDTSANGYLSLNIDLAHRGVGTAACGPDTLAKYRVYPGVYALRLYIW